MIVECRPEQEHFVHIAALSLMNCQCQSRLQVPKTGGMVKRMSILARGVAAEKQGPLLNSLTNHDSKISISESELWLIFTAKHR